MLRQVKAHTTYYCKEFGGGGGLTSPLSELYSLLHSVPFIWGRKLKGWTKGSADFSHKEVDKNAASESAGCVVRGEQRAKLGWDLANDNRNDMAN